MLELREGTAAEAILEIAELLRDHGHVQDYYKFADAVMEREGRSSTNTGEGVAFPHARTDLVERIVLGDWPERRPASDSARRKSWCI